jgi:hypothetical protein
LTDAFVDQPAIPELILAFHTARPLAAAELGELLSALAGDYRRFARGRTLVVARLETGSLYAYLRDALNEVAPYGNYALEIIKAGKGIKEFAQTLRGLLERTKHRPDTLGKSKRPRLVGARSIEAMVKSAAGSQSVIELRHETGDGEIIDLKVTPIEAIRIQEDARTHLTKSPSAQTIKLAPPTGNQIGPGVNNAFTPELFQSSDYADSLARLYGPLGAKAGSAAEVDVRAAVAALANSLISVGLGSIIFVIASNLEGRGHNNLAQMLRAEAQSQRPD